MIENQLPRSPVWVRLAATVISQLPMGRYRAMDRICRKPPPPFLMRLPRDLGGYFFRCDLRDTISREVCFTGRYEPQETALVRSILRPGMTFIDVGANWGYFTLLAAGLVGPKGRVLSIEPDPRLFPILAENVASAHLDQVTVMQLAAAKEAGTLSLVGYSEEGGNFGISKIASASDEAEKVFEVKCDSLDHILARQELLSVDLMKMDIEGAEVFAIPGLEQSLADRKIKRLLLELHPIQLAEHGSSASAVIEKLQGAGYRAWTIDHSPTATREASYKKEINVNALLLPFDSSSQYDAWPHQLWLAPGIE